VAQVVECLTNKHKALTSNPRTVREKQFLDCYPLPIARLDAIGKFLFISLSLLLGDVLSLLFFEEETKFL
jgi:hypothetical protein